MKKSIALVLICMLLPGSVFASQLSNIFSGEIGIKGRSEVIENSRAGSLQFDANVRIYKVFYAEAQYKTARVVDYEIGASESSIGDSERSIGGGLVIPIERDFSVLVAAGIGNEKHQGKDYSESEGKEKTYNYRYGKAGFDALLQDDIHLIGYYKYSEYTNSEDINKDVDNTENSVGLGLKIAPKRTGVTLDAGIELQDLDIVPYIGIGIKF